MPRLRRRAVPLLRAVAGQTGRAAALGAGALGMQLYFARKAARRRLRKSRWLRLKRHQRIALFFAALVLLLYALAALLIWRYPITRAEQAKAAAAIHSGGQATLESLHPPVSEGDAP